MDKKNKKILLFFIGGILILGIYAIIYQRIQEIVPQDNRLFGIPFDYSMFMFGLLILLWASVFTLMPIKRKRRK